MNRRLQEIKRKVMTFNQELREIDLEEHVDWLIEQAERVQELESFIDRFINSLSNNCLKEHIRKYRTDKKLMRTIRRQNEPPSYLSTSDKFALISLTKLFENVAEQNKRYREALEFYAGGKHVAYKLDETDDDLVVDYGEIARKALGG